MRFHRSCVPIAVLTLLAGATWAQAAPLYLRVRFAPAKTPQVYLQLDGQQLRAAPSVAGLAKAKPVTAQQTRRAGSAYFREMPLPVPGPDVQEAKVNLSYSAAGGDPRQTTTYLSCSWTITRRDVSGGAWQYTFSDLQENPPAGGTAAKGLLITIPDLSELSMSLVTQVDEPQGSFLAKLFPAVNKPVRIGIRMRAGKQDLSQLRRAGEKKTPAAHLLVKDKDGQVVHEKDGDLEVFGFT